MVSRIEKLNPKNEKKAGYCCKKNKPYKPEKVRHCSLTLNLGSISLSDAV